MRPWLRSQLTYANVISTLCLFLLLGGGTAVALNGSNTVFSDDLVDNQVFSADVRNDTLSSGGLTAPDLRANSVGSSEVANGSLGTGELSHAIPAARVTRTSAQSIPDSLNTSLAFNQERYDAAGVHDNATNNSRLTAPVTGIYAVTAQFTWGGSAGAGSRFAGVMRNGSTLIARSQELAGDDDENITTQVLLAAGDYVEVQVLQTSGGNLPVAANGLAQQITPEFSMTWLAPGP
ncbi:MAG: hypothetical protein ACRDMH_06435 [Solirubrobacterales bacterium]